MKQQLARFFRPSLAAVILALVFSTVMIIGLADRYSFTCGGSGHKCEGMGIERPTLYGTPCYCWAIWVMTSAPLLWAYFHAFPQVAGNDNTFIIETSLFGSYSAVAFVLNIAYYYVGSCALVYTWKKLRSSPQSLNQSIPKT